MEHSMIPNVAKSYDKTLFHRSNFIETFEEVLGKMEDCIKIIRIWNSA